MSARVSYIYSENEEKQEDRRMEDEKLNKKWKLVKSDFKQRYNHLQEKDLNHSEGDFDKLLNRLQEKTGKSKEELRQEIGKM